MPREHRVAGRGFQPFSHPGDIPPRPCYGGRRGHAAGRVSTAVVQRFCKPKVGGSIPSPGIAPQGQDGPPAGRARRAFAESKARMKRWTACAAMALAALPAWAQDRPPTPVEIQCRQEVDRRYAPGSLSRSRNERQRLIDACVANGGRLPS